MKKYYVSIPITGKLLIEVDAESKDDAIKSAFEQADLKHLDEWETHMEVCKGNVFYGVLSEVDVYEEK